MLLYLIHSISMIIVTGLDEYISCAITFAVCTFYTTIVIIFFNKKKAYKTCWLLTGRSKSGRMDRYYSNFSHDGISHSIGYEISARCWNRKCLAAKCWFGPHWISCVIFVIFFSIIINDISHLSLSFDYICSTDPNPTTRHTVRIIIVFSILF